MIFKKEPFEQKITNSLLSLVSGDINDKDMEALLLLLSTKAKMKFLLSSISGKLKEHLYLVVT